MADQDTAARFNKAKDRLIAATGSPGLTAFHDGEVHMTLGEWERLVSLAELAGAPTAAPATPLEDVLTPEVRQRLAAIRYRERNATRGPWEPTATQRVSGEVLASVSAAWDAAVDICEAPQTPRSIENHEFIAGSRQDIPMLLKLVEALTRAVTERDETLQRVPHGIEQARQANVTGTGAVWTPREAIVKALGESVMSMTGGTR